MPLPRDLSIFDNFTNDIFVETGTCNGSSLDKIVKLEKYREFHSVEALKVSRYHNFEETVKYFESDDRVHLYLDDSTRFLESFLTKLDKPATFWLDAHYAGTASANAYENPVPLKKELELIANHQIKDHVVMIDDVRDFGLYGLTKDAVVKFLKTINPSYNIVFMDCDAAKNDVLIAYP